MQLNVFVMLRSTNIITHHVMGGEVLPEDLSDCCSKWSHPSKSSETMIVGLFFLRGVCCHTSTRVIIGASHHQVHFLCIAHSWISASAFSPPSSSKAFVAFRAALRKEEAASPAEEQKQSYSFRNVLGTA